MVRIKFMGQYSRPPLAFNWASCLKCNRRL